MNLDEALTILEDTLNGTGEERLYPISDFEAAVCMVALVAIQRVRSLEEKLSEVGN